MKLSRHVGHVCRIVWEDACGSSEWHTEAEAAAMPLSRICSIGILHAVASDRVVLVGDRDETGCVNSVTVIPRGWVVSCDRLT